MWFKMRAVYHFCLQEENMFLKMPSITVIQIVVPMSQCHNICVSQLVPFFLIFRNKTKSFIVFKLFLNILHSYRQNVLYTGIGTMFC